MGACTFAVVEKGKSAQDAFDRATADARYEYGHGGYTGTIAEKDEFVMIKPDQDATTWNEGEFFAYAYMLIEADDPRIDDKWGPAGCINMGRGEYLFFGWASS